MTAGEPLAPSSDPRRRGKPSTPPPRRPKRGGFFGRLVRGLIGGLLGLLLLVGVIGGVGGLMAYQHFSADLPDVDGLRSYQPPVMSRVYAGDSRLLSELATERRIFVPETAIPKLVRQAFVSAEDQNFWTHRGVDPIAITRAAVYNLTHMGQGRRPVGASTITQQVAKNMLLDNQLSLGRKIKEAILAMRIEENLSKARILELYLNEIYLGAGAYGVAAAAQAYFNKPLDQLNLQEAAFLAALPKAPNNYNPFRYPDAAKARRDWVIDRMLEDRAISAADAVAAKAEPIIPTEFRRPPPVAGGEWFAEEVRRQLVARFGQDVTTQGGLMVRTSLDPVLQLAAEKALHDGLMAYDRKQGGWRGPIAQLPVTPGFERDWPAALKDVARPAGMLPDWRLALVLSTSDSEARLGWIEAQSGQPIGASTQKTAPLLLQDIAWARPVRDGRTGPPPRKITDVMRVGDVVMIEPPAAAETQAPAPVATPPARGRAAAPPPPPARRVVLRQIPQVQGALVSLNPQTGRVVALVGGWSFEQSQFNRATQANRQPGSSFKPMVYLTALSRGISPSQRFLDAPIVVDTGEGRWRPGNYEGTFNGPTPLRLALEKSLNLVTLRVAQYVGMDAVAQTATAFHMVDSMPRVLPAALGAVETTVIREAGAFASLAAGGREVTPTLIDSVQDRDGHVVWRNQAVACDRCNDPNQTPQVEDTRAQIADPASVFQLVTMMQGAVQRGTGYNAGKGLNRPIAGKTGTTQDFIDAWFSGFTPDLVTTVWVGFDTPSSLGNNETGGSVAAPIFRDYMAVALRDRPVLQFPQPPGVTMASWDTGAGTVTDAFKPDQVPGASTPLGYGLSGVSAVESGPPAPGTVHGGVDNKLGGLY
ncbi:MAG: penicillin-binding protein 1A [Acetobacteraceae bacterium]